MTAGTGNQPPPKAPWTAAVPSPRDPSRRLPQTIAHRGYKASWPENTMAGFEAAVDVGAHALETDLHLSKDGVVVLSHDPSLKRCYGVDKRISECTWDYLSSLKTVREPKQSLPRLSDLLEWLAAPARAQVWVLLDIKIDDAAEELVGGISDVLKQVTPAKERPWDGRVVLGCWNATFIQTARRLLPTYPVAHITWYLPYARHFQRIPNLGYNVLQRSLVGCRGSRFLHDAQREDRPVFAWTVNEVRWMRWCIDENNAAHNATAHPNESRPLLGGEHAASSDDSAAHADATVGVKLIDGVITDDPKLFLEVCRRWEDERDGKAAPEKPAGLLQSAQAGASTLFQVLMFRTLALGLYFLNRHVLNRFDLLPETEAAEAK